MNWKTGLKMTMLAVLMVFASCSKKEVKETKPSRPSVYKIVADSIRVDSTIENAEIIAFACEELFDRKYIGADSSCLNKQFFKNQVSIEELNGNTLVSIHYENWGAIEQFSTGLFLIDTSKQVLSKGVVPGTVTENSKVELKDWNRDKVKELKVTTNVPYSSSDIEEVVEFIYSFDANGGLKEIFKIVKSYRNCSAVMEEKWNYTSRSYSFVSKNEILVKENDYLIDCEQYDRMGSIAKIKRINNSNYSMIWNSKDGAFVRK